MLFQISHFHLRNASLLTVIRVIVILWNNAAVTFIIWEDVSDIVFIALQDDLIDCWTSISWPFKDAGLKIESLFDHVLLLLNIYQRSDGLFVCQLLIISSLWSVEIQSLKAADMDKNNYRQSEDMRGECMMRIFVGVISLSNISYHIQFRERKSQHEYL